VVDAKGRFTEGVVGQAKKQLLGLRRVFGPVVYIPTGQAEFSKTPGIAQSRVYLVETLLSGPVKDKRLHEMFIRIDVSPRNEKPR